MGQNPFRKKEESNFTERPLGDTKKFTSGVNPFRSSQEVSSIPNFTSPQQPQSFGKTFVQEGFVKPGKTVFGGLQKAAGATAGTLDFYSDKMAGLLGKPETKDSIFEYLRDNWNSYGDRLLNEGINSGVMREIYQGLGQALWDIPVKYIGPGKALKGATVPAVGAAEGFERGGVAGAVEGATAGALTHGSIKGLQSLPTSMKIPAAFGFGVATTPGGVKEKVAGGAIWAGLSASPGPTMEEFKRVQAQYNPLVKKGIGFYQSVFNSMHSIEDITARAIKLGMKIQPGENPALRAREYLGIGGKAKTTIEDNTFRTLPDGSLQVTGEGLKPILKDYGMMVKGKQGRQDLTNYLIAKRTISDLQRPKFPGSKENIVSKKQVLEAQNVISKLQAKYGVSANRQKNSIDFFEPIAQRLYGYQRRILQNLVDSGLKSQREVDIILKANPNFVPFDRVMEGIETQTTTPTTKHRFSKPPQPIKRIKGSEREIKDPVESMIKNTYRILDASERNTISRTTTRLNTVFPQEISPVSPEIRAIATIDGKPIFRAIGGGKGKNIITNYENGVKKYYEVSTNLYQAMGGLTESSSNLLVRIMSRPANWVRTGATIVPEFAFRNPIRDQFTALLQTNFGFRPFIDPMHAMADVMGNTKLYKDFLRSGASYSTINELSRNKMQATLKDLTSSKGKKLLKRLNILTDAQDISQFFEVATRVGVFKAARRKGLTPVEAGFQARESTVDFARKGSSKSIKDTNKTIAFFNAGLQGFDKSLRTAIADPIGLSAKAIATITIPSLLLHMRNRKDPDFKEIPQWQRDLFWITKMGDTYVRVPKPFVYGQLFGSGVERFLEYSEEQDSIAFDGFAKSLLQSSSPIGAPEEAAFLPNAIKPLVENMTNWNFFLGRNVVPESTKRLLPPFQASTHTSETARLLGKALNYSPSKIENFTRGYFAGAGGYALQSGDLVLNQIRRMSGEIIPQDPLTPADIPLIKGFTVRDPIGPSAESVQKFYTNASEITNAANTVKFLINNKNFIEAKKIRNQFPQIKYRSLSDKIIRELSEKRKQREEIRNRILPPHLKKRLYKNIDEEIIKKTRKFNSLIKRSK